MTRIEKDLKDHEPRRISGVRGVKSRPFSKKFRNQEHMENWLELHGDDHEVHTIERAENSMRESSEVVDAILSNEPAQAVEAMQDLIKARARDMIAARFEGATAEQEAEGDDVEEAA